MNTPKAKASDFVHEENFVKKNRAAPLFLKKFFRPTLFSCRAGRFSFSFLRATFFLFLFLLRMVTHVSQKKEKILIKKFFNCRRLSERSELYSISYSIEKL